MHYFVILFVLGLSTLAFYKLSVVDTRREREKLVGKILSGEFPLFICGGVAYGNAQEISKDYIAAHPVSMTGGETQSVVLDKRDISRAFIVPEGPLETKASHD